MNDKVRYCFDDTVCNLLLQWGITELIVPFAVHNVNKENFHHITDDWYINGIEKLEHKYLLRDTSQKFRQKFNQWCQEWQIYSGLSMPQMDVTQSTRLPSFMQISSQTQQDSIVRVTQEDNSVSNIDLNAVLDHEYSEELLPVSAEILSQLYSYADFYDAVKKKTDIYKMLDDRNDNNLLGNMVLSCYARTKKVPRKVLSRLAIQYAMKCTLQYAKPFALTGQYLKNLANQITLIFSDEAIALEIYFEASILLKVVGETKKKRTNSKGYLIREYYSFRNLAASMHFMCLRADPNRAVARKSKDPEKVPLDIPIHLLKKKEVDPKEVNEMLDQWAKSDQYRMRENFIGLKLFEEFPILGTAYGSIMILNDFRSRGYVNYEKELLLKWSPLVLQILNLAIQKMKKATVKGVKKTTTENLVKLHTTILAYTDTDFPKLENYVISKPVETNKAQENLSGILDMSIEEDESINDELVTSDGFANNDALGTPNNTPNILTDEDVRDYRRVCKSYASLYHIFVENAAITSSEHATALSFLVLPLCLPYGIKSINDWKPNADGRTYTQHFIEVIESHSKLELVIKGKREDYKKYDISPLQPYMVYCGPVDNITCYHVVLDGTVYDAKNAILAVDLCFKSFFSLRIPYSIGSPQVWSFFHKVIYGMDVTEKSIHATQTVNKLKTELGIV